MSKVFLAACWCLFLIGQAWADKDGVEQQAQQTKVTLAIKEMPVAKALETIAAAGGMAIRKNIPADVPDVTLDVKDIPLIDAVRLVTQIAGLEYTVKEDGIEVSAKSHRDLLVSQGAAEGLSSPAPVAAGLAVVLGTTDGEIESALANRAGWVVLGLAYDPQAGAAARARLARTNLLGRVTVLDVMEPQRIPVADNAAAVVVVDPVRLGRPAPSAEEMMRVVRPLGKLRVKRDGKWQEQVKPWPKEFDDWPMYFHDAQGSDVSKDTAVGPVHGLQWHCGDDSTQNQVGLRSCRGLVASAEQGTAGARPGDRLVMRDAFTGIRQWERNDLELSNRYMFLMDGQYVYVHPDGAAHMIAMDSRTGQTARQFDQGIDLATMDYKKNVRDVEVWPSAILHGGKLIQVGLGKIAVLDAATGQCVWAKDLGGNRAHLPTIVGDTLAVVQGGKVIRSPAYLKGWNACRMDAVVFYDLQAGEEKRRWTPAGKKAFFVLHMCHADGAIGLVAGTEDGSPEGETRAFCLNAEDGTLRWDKTVGASKGGFRGHPSTARVLIQNGKFWYTGLRDAVSYDLKDGGNPVKLSYLVNQCQPTRATPNYHFSALCALRLSDNKLYRSEASRTACDIGPFLSGGLVYTTDSNCGCHPFLAGYNAFHSLAPIPAYAGERLRSGAAKAPPKTEAPWLGDADWPMYMRDPQRSNWTEAKLGDSLKPAWTVTFTDPAAGLPGLSAQDWRRTALSHAPITAPTSAGGLVLLAIIDTHQIVALDAATGKERWRAVVDGRVDSPPTLYRGVAVLGTRNGWAYALSLGTGEVLWRFLAAPAQQQIVANGQPESAWPVFGTVAIHDGLAWLYAGRSTQLDGGLYWYALDPATGKTVKSGVLSSQEQWRDAAGKESYSTATLGTPPDTASPWALTADGSRFLMARVGLDTKSGKMLRAGVDYWFPGPTLFGDGFGRRVELGLPSCVLPRRFGLLYNGFDTAFLYPVSFYAGVLAKIFAYRGGDVVALQSSVPNANRGGGAGGLKRWRTESIGKTPDPKEAPATLVWKADAFPVPRKGSAGNTSQVIAKAGDHVLVNEEKALVAYRYADGSRVAQYPLPSLPVHNGIAVAGGRVIVCCEGGEVVALTK